MGRFGISWVMLSLASVAWGVIIDDYAAGEHDRFAPEPNSFIAKDFDLSGVAISSDGRWATLIAPNIYLSANHFKPGVGQTIRFYKTHDLNGESVLRTVTSTRQKIGSTDLFINTLNESIPEGYAYYAYATESVSVTPYAGQNLIHVGRSQGNYSRELDVAVGRNVLDRLLFYQSSPSINASGPAYELTQNSEGTAGFVDHETMAQIGDSGGPLFFDQGDDTLRLVGIAWYINGIPATGFSPVGDQSNSIDSFVNQHELPYQPLAPTGFTLNRINATTIELSWTDVSAVETKFVVERATTIGGPWTALAELQADVETVQDTSVPEGDVLYRIRAENDSASDWVEVSDLTPYGEWASGVDWNGADSSGEGDANSDGLANLIAYAFGFDPLQPAPPESLPDVSSDVGVVDLTYHRNPDAVDVTYEVQMGSNLEIPDWQEVIIDGTTVTETDLGPVGDARLIRVRLPQSSVPDVSFFRLEVVR